MLVFGAGGCGASSTHTSHAATTAPATSTAAPATSTAAPAVTTSSTTTRRQTTMHATHTTTTAASSTATHTSQTQTTSAAPVVSNGLRPATGYSSYDDCSAPCSGSVPASMQRPLHLPQLAAGASCPVSAGSGPVRPIGSAELSVSPFIDSSWQGGRVTWASASSYTGPVLIRGGRLGATGAVGFGAGHVPVDALQLLAPGMGAPTPPGGGREWPSFTRVQAPGCYGYQVDGTAFSEVIVFRVTG
jgi:hypothetical protein